MTFELAASLLLMALLVAGSGYLSLAEAALFSLSRLKRRSLERRLDPSARVVLDLLRHPHGVLITILLCDTALTVALSAVGTSTAREHVGGARAIGLAVVLVTAANLIAGELLPKVVGVRLGESFALRTAPWIDFLYRALYPVAGRFEALASGATGRLALADRAGSSPGEILTLLRMGTEGGLLASQEAELVEAILGLRDSEASEVMTPRVEIVGVSLEVPAESLREAVQRTRKRVVPVYGADLDDLRGVLLARRFLLAGPSAQLEEFVVEPLCVPEGKKLVDLLDDFRKIGQHFAMVLDEHGGTSGLITLEDILEEIFGEVFRPGEAGEADIRRVEDGFRLAGKASLSAVEAETGLRFDDPALADVSTVAGFLMARLGRLPRRGDEVDEKGFCFRVVHVVKRRTVAVDLVARAEVPGVRGGGP